MITKHREKTNNLPTNGALGLISHGAGPFLAMICMSAFSPTFITYYACGAPSCGSLGNFHMVTSQRSRVQIAILSNNFFQVHLI